MGWLRRWMGGGSAADSKPSPALSKGLFAPPDSLGYRFADPAVRIAVTADIHGRSDLLREHFVQLDRLAADRSKRLIEIYLGDYVDRAGNPREVLDLLIERKARAGHALIFLLGNHEDMFLAALESDAALVSWIEAGGHSTLSSYGISPAGVRADPTGKRRRLNQEVGPAHRSFLAELQLVYRHGGFFFVHAGVRPSVPLDRQSREDLLWIREDFLTSDQDFGEIVVHGHTPAPLPQFKRNRIGLDIGACYSGTMMSLVIDSRALGAVVTQAANDEP